MRSRATITTRKSRMPCPRRLPQANSKSPPSRKLSRALFVCMVEGQPRLKNLRDVKRFPSTSAPPGGMMRGRPDANSSGRSGGVAAHPNLPRNIRSDDNYFDSTPASASMPIVSPSPWTASRSQSFVLSGVFTTASLVSLSSSFRGSGPATSRDDLGAISCVPFSVCPNAKQRRKNSVPSPAPASARCRPNRRKRYRRRAVSASARSRAGPAGRVATPSAPAGRSCGLWAGCDR